MDSRRPAGGQRSRSPKTGGRVISMLHGTACDDPRDRHAGNHLGAGSTNTVCGLWSAQGLAEYPFLEHLLLRACPVKRSFLPLSAVLLVCCSYSAPDYRACDPDRPSEVVALATFDRTLEGMDAPVQAILDAVEGEHTATLYAEGEGDGEGEDEAVALTLSFSFEPEAQFIPASQGCNTDRLELAALTRVIAPNGDSDEGEWSFSLSRSTAEETFGGFDTSHGELMIDALGLSVEATEQLGVGFGARFVSSDDPSQALFQGSGTISTLGGPSTASVPLAHFSWGE